MITKTCSKHADLNIDCIHFSILAAASLTRTIQPQLAFLGFFGGVTIIMVIKRPVLRLTSDYWGSII